MLRFQNTNNNEFGLFIRNLNENINTNIFNLLDRDNKPDKIIKKKKRQT